MQTQSSRGGSFVFYNVVIKISLSENERFNFKWVIVIAAWRKPNFKEGGISYCGCLLKDGILLVG